MHTDIQEFFDLETQLNKQRGELEEKYAAEVESLIFDYADKYYDLLNASGYNREKLVRKDRDRITLGWWFEGGKINVTWQPGYYFGDDETDTFTIPASLLDKTEFEQWKAEQDLLIDREREKNEDKHREKLQKEFDKLEYRRQELAERMAKWNVQPE